MHGPPASSTIPYRTDIDGLRAIAVLLVVLFHFRLPGSGRAGFMGVDVFFVISGFLITSIVAAQLRRGSFRLSHFYANRVRRLAPALVAVLLMTWVAGALLLFPHDLRELSLQTLLTQLYLVNIYYWQNLDYFGLRADFVYLLHAWSLSVEEQFYLVYPPLLWLIYRVRRRLSSVLLALGFLGSFALNVWLVEDKPELTFYLLPTRGFELLAGALVAVVPALSPSSRRACEALAFAGAASLVAGLLLYQEGAAFPGAFALLPVLGTAALLAGGQRQRPSLSRVLSWSPLVYIGRISYSLYLVHWPINVFAHQWLGQRYDLGFRLASCAASFAVAGLLYRYVETPTRRRTLLASTPRLLGAYGGSLALTAAFFTAVWSTDGLPQRFSAEVTRAAAYADDRPPALSHCEYRARHPLQVEQMCRLGDPQVAPRLMIYGDSHAWAAHPAFDLWLKRDKQQAYFAFLHACPPVLGAHMYRDRGECFAFNKAVAQGVAEHPEIERVILVSTWAQPAAGALTDDPHRRLEPAQSMQLFEASLTRTLEHYARARKRVYVWEPLPGTATVVPATLARALHFGASTELSFPRSTYARDYGFFFRALERNAPLVAGRIESASVLCDDTTCDPLLDGKPAYFDNNHLALWTREHWARLLQRTLGGVGPSELRQRSNAVRAQGR